MAAQAERVSSLLRWATPTVLAVLLGVFLRSAEFIQRGPLWMDEATLSMSIAYRDIPELLERRLWGNTEAPRGYAILARLCVETLGNNEHVLRLIPFLASLASIPLFLLLARRTLLAAAVPMAMLLFALSDSLIRYSGEAKPYAMDALCALVLTLAALALIEKPASWGRYALAALAGAVAVWLSYGSLLVMAGVGVVLTIRALSQKQWQALGALLLMFAVWAASFGYAYLRFIRATGDNERIAGFWKGAFMPLPPKSLADLKWFFITFFDMLRDPGGFELAGLAALFLVVGIIALWRRSRWTLWLLLAPLAVGLLASGLHKYPFAVRFLLFAVPALLLLIAEGLQFLRQSLSAESAWVGKAAAVLLLLHPASQALDHLLQPRLQQDLRPIVAYIQDHHTPTDIVYLYEGAEQGFTYYAKRIGLDQQITMMSGERAGLATNYADLEKLSGQRRVWVVTSHILERDGGRFREDFFYMLSRFGVKLDEIEAKGAAAYLYDLSRPGARGS